MKTIVKFLTFILLIFSTCFFGMYFFQNVRLWDHHLPKFALNTDSSVYNPYSEKVPMEKINFKKLTYLNGWVLYQPPFDREPVYNLSLPEDITYYTQKNGKFVPTFTVKAGTEVLAFPDGMLEPYKDMPTSGYGVYSWPTYWKGWRYARPFVPENEYDPDGENYYYVKLADLDNFLVWFFKEGPQSEYWMNGVRRLKFGWSIWDGAKLYTLHADQGMWINGFYQSPDLRNPIWTKVHTKMLLLTLLFGFAFLFAYHKYKKRTKINNL